MIRYLTLTSLVFILFHCSSPTRTNEQQSETQPEFQQDPESETKLTDEPKISELRNDSSFLTYLELIPQLELPLEFECEKGFPVPELDYDHPAIKANIVEGGTIIGKLYQTENEVGIVYGFPADIFFPMMAIHNLEGSVIGDFKFFMLRECAGDAGYVAKTKGTITEDLILQTTTEIIRWDYENDGPMDTTRTTEEVRIIN